MKKTNIYLILLLLVFPQFSFAESLSYSVSLDYSSGEFSLRSLELANIAPNPTFSSGQYTTRIMSFRDEILYETTFRTNADIFFGLPVSAEDIPQKKQENNALITLILPYYPNSKSLHILRENKLLLEADLSRYSVCNQNNVCDASETYGNCADCTCGNQFCDYGENYMSCSKDCASGQKDGVCDRKADGLCDADCSAKNDIDCKKSGNWLLFLGIGTIIAAAIYYLLYFRTANKVKKPKK